VGAVLGQIGQAHPEARLSSIDLNPEQIATARGHLAGLGLEAVDNRTQC
jgi:predicted O-methyltransferase YrrM